MEGRGHSKGSVQRGQLQGVPVIAVRQRAARHRAHLSL